MPWNRDWHSRAGFHLSQAVGNGNRQRKEKVLVTFWQEQRACWGLSLEEELFLWALVMATWFEGLSFPILGGNRCWVELLKEKNCPCGRGLARLCHVRREPTGREQPQAPTVPERREVLVIRHCPCSWATQRIFVTDDEFHMFWGWNALWMCSTQEGAPGISGKAVWTGSRSQKKAAGRRIDADEIMSWKYLQSPDRRAVDFCNSSRGLKWQKVWSLLMYSTQRNLPELGSETGSTVKIVGADRKEKRARKEAKMPPPLWLWHQELGFDFLNFREDDVWG